MTFDDSIGPIRIPKAGKQAIQAEADKEDRKLGAMIRVLLSEALNARAKKSR